MIWQAITGGITYTLNDGDPFSLIAANGIGQAAVRRLSERGPYQHGDTDTGFRLEPRVITLALFAHADTLADMDTHRTTLQTVFRPSTTAIKLRATRDDGAIRQIDGHVLNMLDWPHGGDDRIGASQRMAVQLRCPDPSWYDPTPLALVLDSISNSTRGYPVAVAVPVVQTPGSTIDGSDTINYAGTWPDYPIVYLVGPLTDPVLTHVTLGLTLDFTGITIASGKTYTIDLRYGYKTVTDGDGANAIDELTADSDLAEWRLEPGTNQLNLTATGATGASGARLLYTLRYAGL